MLFPSLYTLLMLFSCSVTSNSLWPPWTAAHQASLSFTISQTLLKFMSVESLMPFNHLILCCPLLLLLSIFPSIRVFSNESALRIRWHMQVQMLKVPSLWLPFFPTSFPVGVIPHQSPWRIYSLWGNMPRNIYPHQVSAVPLPQGRMGSLLWRHLFSLEDSH